MSPVIGVVGFIMTLQMMMMMMCDVHCHCGRLCACVVQVMMLIEEVRLEAFPHLHFSMDAKITGEWMAIELLRPNKGETLQVLDAKGTPIDPSLLKGAYHSVSVSILFLQLSLLACLLAHSFVVQHGCLSRTSCTMTASCHIASSPTRSECGLCMTA